MMVEGFRRQPASEHQQGLPQPSPSQYELNGSSEGGCRWTIQVEIREGVEWAGEGDRPEVKRSRVSPAWAC